MSDDIVTRLREYEAITDNAYVINALVAAADEIERLRAENTDLRGTLVKTETTGVRLWQMASSSRDSYADEVMVLRDEIERLRAEVARLGSFLHPIGMIIQGEAVRDE